MITPDGTTYHPETPAEVRAVLERARLNGWRLRLHYGDRQTGRDWEETHDVAGTIGRSLGPVKVPLLIPTRRSYGGPAILDHCIVRIRFSNKRQGGELYRHPHYHT